MKIDHNGAFVSHYPGIVARGQPGPIDMDLNPASEDWAMRQIANTALNRYGHVDDVAALVAFVAGPDASYITGANLTVDGGTVEEAVRGELEVIAWRDGLKGKR